jgi:hypothetical protein
MRAPAVARTAAAAVLLLLLALARPAAAQSEAVQVACNLNNTNVTVAYLGPAGSNKTGLLCGYSVSSYFTASIGNFPSVVTCYDSVQAILSIGGTGIPTAQLPQRGIIFHDYLLCAPPSHIFDNNNAPTCLSFVTTSSPGQYVYVNLSYIVYVGAQC